MVPNQRQIQGPTADCYRLILIRMLLLVLSGFISVLLSKYDIISVWKLCIWGREMLEIVEQVKFMQFVDVRKLKTG